MFEVVTWPRNPWSIFDELEMLQSDMNRTLGGRAYQRPLRRERPTFPLLNVWSSKEGIIIDAELPGMDPNDVEVSMNGNELTVQGKINTEEPAAGETYHRKGRPAGTFMRTLQLPFRADSGGTKANYKNGVLRLTIPRSEAEKPKKIAVEAS